MQESLGEYLKQWRLQKGLSLEGIALRTRIPLPYLQALEQDDFSSLPPLQIEESLGEYLTQWRLQKGISLEAIAKTTRIPLRYLEALEGNEYWKLPPAMIIAKAYVKTYCRCLDLQEAEEAEVMIRFAALAEAIYGKVVAETPKGAVTETPWLSGLYFRLTQKFRPIYENLLSILSTKTLKGKACLVRVISNCLHLIREIGTRLWSWFPRIVTRGMRGFREGHRRLWGWLEAITGGLVSAIGMTVARGKQGGRVDLHRLVQWTGVVRYTLAMVTSKAAMKGKGCLQVSHNHLGQWVRVARDSVAGGIAKTTEEGKARWMHGACVLAQLVRDVQGCLGSGIANFSARGKIWFKKGHDRMMQRVGIVRSLLASVSKTASKVRAWLNQGLLALTQAAEGFGDRIGTGLAWIFPNSGLEVSIDRWHQLLYSKKEPEPRFLSTQSLNTDVQLEDNTSPYMGTIPQPEANKHRLGELMNYGLPAVRSRERAQDRFSQERYWMKNWGLVVQYGIAMLLALALATILGNLQLFKEVSIGGTKLTASRIVQFMGYGGALVLFWLLGRRLSLELAEGGKWHSQFRYLIMPLVTLIVLSAGYNVLLFLGAPFLGATGKAIYNWMFVILILSAALWLIMVWFQRATTLLESLEPLWKAGPTTDQQSALSCPQCRGPVATGMRYCGHCGERVT